MKKITKKAFTMIEVIIGVFIFSLGLVSVFMLFGESSKLSVKSKNMIIATGLAREGVELVKNIRDSNYKKNIKFSWIPNDETDIKIKYKSPHLFTGGTTASGTYYKIENVNFDKSNSFLPIKVEKINVSDIGTKTNLEKFQLCLDNDNIYYYCKTGDTKKTDFYRYINFKPAKIGGNKIIPDTFKVVSVVEWKKAGGGKVEIPFILADWKRQ